MLNKQKNGLCNVLGGYHDLIILALYLLLRKIKLLQRNMQLINISFIR